MNIQFRTLFGVEIGLIPLREAGRIEWGNALRLDWAEFCDGQSDGELFIVGNPPYLGGTKQTAEQTAEVAAAFGNHKISKYTDYVAGWVYKAAELVSLQGAVAGLVTTNSIVQGAAVAEIWTPVFDAGAQISFAHTSFPWANNARSQAGVVCVILGLSKDGVKTRKRVFGGGTVRECKWINAYLIPDGPSTIVSATTRQVNALPKMVFGSMPRDNGSLVVTLEERREMLAESPEAGRLLRRYWGAEEYINGGDRYCLWVSDEDLDFAWSIPSIAERLTRVRRFRRDSKADSTRAAAASPHRFVQIAHREAPALIVPSASSSRREYIPCGFVGPDVVVSNAMSAAYGAEAWVLGLVQSSMHMAWMRTVGGRLGDGYRYAPTLVYNTFPVPRLTEEQEAELSFGAMGVLASRESFPGKTLADLYDPEAMPAGLRAAHADLDEIVDRIYKGTPFESDEQRLELLFDMYGTLTSGKALTLDA